MKNDNDLSTIERILNGDLGSFSFLVDKYKDMAYTIAIRIVRNEQDAEEVVQDSFLKAFKSLNGFKKQSSFSTWFYRIVYNTSLTKIRRKQIEVTPVDEEIINRSVDETEDALVRLSQQERKKFIDYAISKLSEEEATILQLFYQNDKLLTEVAEIMDMSHGNVRVKLSRARKKLHGHLDFALKNEIENLL